MTGRFNVKMASKFSIGESVRVLGSRFEAHQVNDVDDPNLEFGQPAR